MRTELSDATHHCWAFVAGPPGSTTHVGLSDDGEPHGTAGRPILNVLLHSGVGHIVAVVTRYFGGAKLGKGGLGRAYSGSAAKAIETLRTEKSVPLLSVRIRVPFSSSDSLFRLLEELGARGREERYESEVEVVTQIPQSAFPRLEGQIAGLTSGQGRVEGLPGPTSGRT